ncbi:hypothetical protein GS506_17660 [Rhodococcus hoagii]|nr:hypothetical protein [Prescottella equi]
MELLVVCGSRWLATMSCRRADPGPFCRNSSDDPARHVYLAAHWAVCASRAGLIDASWRADCSRDSDPAGVVERLRSDSGARIPEDSPGPVIVVGHPPCGQIRTRIERCEATVEPAVESAIFGGVVRPQAVRSWSPCRR